MSGGAHVDSFEVVREFRAAVATFADEARDALATYDLELGRTLEWLLAHQPQAWQQEIRNAEEAIRVAKIELGRCRSQRLPGGGEPSCMEEKKLLERAKRRHQFAEEKLVVTRKWGQTFNRDATQYTSQASQLSDLFDADLPRALALLDRVLITLEAYVGLSSGMPRPAELQTPGRSGTAASGSQPAAAPPGTAEPGTAPPGGEASPSGAAGTTATGAAQTAAAEPPARLSPDAVEGASPPTPPAGTEPSRQQGAQS